MKTIKINGEDSSVLSVELKDVLNCIDQGEKSYWGLLWLDATVIPSNEPSLVDIYREVNNSEVATVVAWEELIKLSSQINQTIDIVIIGDNDVANIIKYSTDEQMYNSCDYTLELIDSSYWIVHSNDDSFIEGVFDRLHGVEYCDALG